MAGLHIEFRAPILTLNTLKTAYLATLIFSSQTLITRGEMFMPTRSIFIIGQTPCRIDGRPPD
jgi:hypothetical protein